MALSGWQTVVITVGVSAVTGLAALLVSVLTGRQARARLDRQLDHERERRLNGSSTNATSRARSVHQRCG
jgi:hypothetical protein